MSDSKPKLMIGDLITLDNDRQVVVMGFDAEGRAIVRDVSIEACVMADIAKVLSETKS